MTNIITVPAERETNVFNALDGNLICSMNLQFNLNYNYNWSELASDLHGTSQEETFGGRDAP